MESGGTSRHHLAWNRRNYKSPLERKYRQHHGMIVYGVDDEWHRELHASLRPPHKPTPQLMAGALVRLSQSQLVSPLDGLYIVSEFMLERDSKLSISIGEHLLQQAVYLQSGIKNKNIPCE